MLRHQSQHQENQDIGEKFSSAILICQFLFLSHFLTDLENTTLQNNIRRLLISLYCEKIYVYLHEYIANITHPNWYCLNLDSGDLFIRALLNQQDINLNDLHNGLEKHIQFKKNHYSPITKLLPTNLIEWGNKLTNMITPYLPRSLKMVGNFIYDQFTLSNNVLIAKTAMQRNMLQRKWWWSDAWHTPVNANLTSVSDNDSAYLIETLKSGDMPYDVFVTWDEKISAKNKSDIILWININQLNKAALACITLQQGLRDENSIIAKLPKDILLEIYKFLYPFSISKNNNLGLAKQKHFINNVSKNKSALFNYINTPSVSESLYIAALFELPNRP